MNVASRPRTVFKKELEIRYKKCRPICFLSSTNTVSERTVSKILSRRPTDLNLMNEIQYRFQYQRSIVIRSISSVPHIATDRKDFVSVCCSDFLEVFDPKPSSLLSKKIQRFEIRGSLYELSKVFLSNGSQQLFINKAYLDEQRINENFPPACWKICVRCVQKFWGSYT
ncbi:hypothetical protein Y032_0208g2076 [Ancylostoma ceylanicum]|uniref:Uncharacterized protein n=1 Tax=Ancylostoma ceylanicum TaxID=53326 RepID=A0A016SKU3_9BILA|nr:hypothetical protein Y032_0208g2076 [Ancylostoma ceylanicum]